MAATLPGDTSAPGRPCSGSVPPPSFTAVTRRVHLTGTSEAQAYARLVTMTTGQCSVAGPPPPGQVHVQFGADAATEIAVSWATPAPAAPDPAGRPRLRVGLPGGG